MAAIITFFSVFIICYAYSLSNDILVHSLIDIFIMAGSWIIFIIAWNSRFRLKNNFYLVWGVSYLFYGVIILFHFLLYENIGILNDAKNVSLFVWILGCYYLSICFWVSTFYTELSLNDHKFLWILFFIILLIIGMFFSYLLLIPYMDDGQLTLFNIISELIIFMISIANLHKISKQKHHFSLKVLFNIKMGLVLFILTQSVFLIALQNHQFVFLLYHFFQLASMYYIYQVFIEMGVSRPLLSSFNAVIQKHKDTRDHERNYHLLFDHMNEGVAYHKIITDKHGTPVDYIFLNINQSFERHTGLKHQDLIGKEFSKALPDIYHGDTDWVQIYGEVALEGKPLQFEQYSDPLDRWFHISAFSPKKGYFAAIVKDITQKKRDEIKLEAQQDELIAHMKESTQEIYEKDLSLLKVKEEYSEFACILSHDLCEPLRGIYNLTHMLKESSIKEIKDRSLDRLSYLSQTTHERIMFIMRVLQKKHIKKQVTDS